jgi:hypothetical protein
MFIQRNRWRLSRRTFLEAAGIALALPWLEAMGVRSTSVTNAGEITSSEIPRRAYFSHWGFFEARAGIPKTTGVNYTLTPTLAPLQPYKNDCTVISGMTAFSGGHNAQGTLLTGVNMPDNGKRLISVDQQIAGFYHGKTRVPSLTLGIHRQTGFGGAYPLTLSWSANHTPILPENRPEVVFNRLFQVDDKATRAAKAVQMENKASILDQVKTQVRHLEKKLGKDDRATVEQYLTSIRDVEERIKTDRAWLDQGKPAVAPLDFGKTSLVDQAKVNDDGTGMKRYLRLMFDVIALAFQTDSTRVVAHYPKGEGGPTFKDRTRCPHDYHLLSHHGEDEEKLRFWAQVDQVYMEHWAYFLGKLKSIKEGNGTLLDHTMAAWATTNGEYGHGRTNLPLILCGGAGLGLKHQGHLVKQGVMIGNVWQTMLNRLGMPVPRDFQGGQANDVIKEVL